MFTPAAERCPCACVDRLFARPVAMESKMGRWFVLGCVTTLMADGLLACLRGVRVRLYFCPRVDVSVPVSPSPHILVVPVCCEREVSKYHLRKEVMR